MTDATPPKAPKAAASKAAASKPAAASKAATPPVPPVPPAPTAPPPPAAAPVQQPYGQQPAYGAGGYVPPMGPPTNTLAIIALILGFIVPLGGIICGHIALGQIKRTGEAGHGLALAGTIIGYVLTGLTILFVLFYVIFFVALFSSGVLTSVPSI